MIPSLCAVPCMVLNGMHSDATGERRWHVAIPALIGAAGWGLAAVLKSPVPYLFAFALTQIGVMSVLPTFWSLPTSFLSGALGGRRDRLDQLRRQPGGILRAQCDWATPGANGQLLPRHVWWSPRLSRSPRCWPSSFPSTTAEAVQLADA